MIESVFMMMLGMAFILFIIGIELESIVFTATSLLLWIVILAQSFYIWMPGDTYYTEYGVNAFSLAFIFIDIVWLILLYTNWKKERMLK